MSVGQFSNSFSLPRADQCRSESGSTGGPSDLRPNPGAGRLGPLTTGCVAHLRRCKRDRCDVGAEGSVDVCSIRGPKNCLWLIICTAPPPAPLPVHVACQPHTVGAGIDNGFDGLFAGRILLAQIAAVALVGAHGKQAAAHAEASIQAARRLRMRRSRSTPTLPAAPSSAVPSITAGRPTRMTFAVFRPEPAKYASLSRRISSKPSTCWCSCDEIMHASQSS